MAFRKRRKPRRGEWVCRCRAYDFPHRFGGGKCSGLGVAEDYWQDHYGSGNCKHCHCFNPKGHYCEVEVGQESVDNGVCWQEFVEYHEIKIYPSKSKIKGTRGSLLFPAMAV